MPTGAGKRCNYPGCREIIFNKSHCPAHTKQITTAKEQRRGSSTSRGYDRKWRAARLNYLMRYPLCVKCTEEGRTEAAVVVDHKTPHKGDQVLFWNESNWQPLCKRHHDIKTATEDGGFGR